VFLVQNYSQKGRDIILPFSFFSSVKTHTDQLQMGVVVMTTRPELNEKLMRCNKHLKKALIKRNIKLSEQAIIHAESEG